MWNERSRMSRVKTTLTVGLGVAIDNDHAFASPNPGKGVRCFLSPFQGGGFGGSR
jgi:hypothetical protein